MSVGHGRRETVGFPGSWEQQTAARYPSVGDCHGTPEREIRVRMERRVQFGRGQGVQSLAGGLCGSSGKGDPRRVWGEGECVLGP